MSSFSLLRGKLTSQKWDLFSFMSRKKDAELSILTFLVVQVVRVFTFQPNTVKILAYIVLTYSITTSITMVYSTIFGALGFYAFCDMH